MGEGGTLKPLNYISLYKPRFAFNLNIPIKMRPISYAYQAHCTGAKKWVGLIQITLSRQARAYFTGCSNINEILTFLIFKFQR